MDYTTPQWNSPVTDLQLDIPDRANVAGRDDASDHATSRVGDSEKRVRLSS